MCGGSDAPPPVDPQAEAQAQLMLERERMALQRQQEERARQREEAERQRKLEEFRTNLDATRTGAQSRVAQEIDQRGIQGYDSTYFADQISQELQRIASGIPQLDPNPGSYFQDDIASLILNKERDKYRNQYTNALEGIAPFGFAQQQVPDTADDAILSAILGERYQTAAQQVQNAFSRGNLNEQGFTTAQKLLDQSKQTGSARLTEIGNAILGTDRDQLRDTADTYRGRASNFELGQQFDPSSLQSALEGLRSEQVGTLEGRVRGAAGNERFFDPASILNSAGATQGAFNPATGSQATGPGSLLASLTQRNQERDKERGVGSQGVF